MAKAMEPFRDSRAPSWHSGPLTDIPTEPPSHRPSCDKSPGGKKHILTIIYQN